jgi:hypothetical protein
MDQLLLQAKVIMEEMVLSTHGIIQLELVVEVLVAPEEVPLKTTEEMLEMEHPIQFQVPQFIILVEAQVLLLTLVHKDQLVAPEGQQ